MTKRSHDYTVIRESGLFSRAWYLEQYHDVAASGVDPLEHYLSDGAAEGRDPGPDFSTSGYLARYGDVASSGINPLLHYIRYGRAEGRIGAPYVDPRKIKRPYHNLGGYLTHSLLDPLVKAPFAEVDQECFEVMEYLAGWLCRKAGERTEQPLISVIMPVRDRAGVVGDSIRSVLGQSYHNFELIVVDDGSRDKSVEVVRSFADPRVRLLEHADPKGVSATRNRGLDVAKGELIAYLDSDNTWLPDYLAAMAGAFQVLPDADAVYCGQFLYRGCEREPFAVRFGCYNPALLRNRNYIDLNCFVHRSAVLEVIGGGFCEELKRWVDWELILRISRRCRIYSVPVLMSNYFMEKAGNTLSASEQWEPAREYIMTRDGYGRHTGTETSGDRLTRKVLLVVWGRDGLDNVKACVDSLAGHALGPLVRIVVVAAPSGPDVSNSLRGLDSADIRTILADHDVGLFQAMNQAVHDAGPDSDVLLLDHTGILTSGALPALQQAAYASDAIAIAAPQQLLAGGDPLINTHVPYAFHDAPCDVTLSNHFRNVEPLPLFHAGGTLDLNFVSFFCMYIRRDAWESCNGLDARQGRELRADRVLCEFVRHVLGKRIVYTPDAIVFHRAKGAGNGIDRGGNA
jgi:GT2 family glycosyltransferase